jgi:hypothetical protein
MSFFIKFIRNLFFIHFQIWIKSLLTVNWIFESTDHLVNLAAIDVIPFSVCVGFNAAFVTVVVVLLSIIPVSDHDLVSICDINEVFSIFVPKHSQPALYLEIKLVKAIEFCVVLKISKLAAKKTTNSLGAFPCHQRVDWHLDVAGTRRWNCCREGISGGVVFSGGVVLRCCWWYPRVVV